DQPALIKALSDGTLSYAALDVFVEEPLPEDSLLFDVPNLIMTPHISGNFPDYTKRVHELFLENLRRYLNNEPLKFVVNKSRGY
ncbi:D-2-hydroxyacid dehydrogenase, partial [bacterium]|nr:D-2-hydroxyacid dehydrogenase [bacterium]